MPGARERPELRTIPEGRYRCLNYLGGGGMGTVYLATDTEMNRRVALKIAVPARALSDDGSPLSISPPPDSEAARTHAARFLQEAWVTGNLEHPGIAPVYEVGLTPGGTTYYTMRLIHGDRTLEDAIRGARTLPERLPILDAFLKVCDAIAFAHAHGVIHRDLKPANIALGEYGEVVVIDWGLARAGAEGAGTPWQEKAKELRDAGDIETADSALGTAGYMPPEATLGQGARVDEKSDVFSLGMILFRILTGALPFRFGTYEEYVKKLLTGVIPLVREVEPEVPEGLSRICAMAIERNPGKRWQSVAELAQAIRAWQRETARDREVGALLSEAEAALAGAGTLTGDALLKQVDRVTSITGRVLHLAPEQPDAIRIREAAGEVRERGLRERERAGRRRLLIRSGVVVVLLFAVAAVVVAGLLDRARREAESAREQAVAERDRAEDLAQFMLFDLRRGLRKLGRLDLLEAVADRTRAYYDQLPADTLNDDSRRRKAIALGRVGEVLRGLGDLEGAEEVFRDSLGLLSAVHAVKPESAHRRHDLAIGHLDLGEVLLRLERGDEALESFETAQSLLVGLVREQPDEVDWRKDRAYSLNRIGEVLDGGDQEVEAIRLFEEARVVRRGLVADHPEDEALLLDYSSSLSRAAGYEQDPERAAGLLHESFSIQRRLLDLDPQDPERMRNLALCHYRIGRMLTKRGEREEALKSHQAALEIYRQLVELDPRNERWEREHRSAAARTADLLRASGD